MEEVKKFLFKCWRGTCGVNILIVSNHYKIFGVHFPCLQLSFVIILLLEINCNNCYTNSLLIFDNYLDWYNLFSIFITNLLLKVQLGASISLYQFLDYFEMNLLIWNYYLNYLLTKSVLTCLIGSTSKKIYKI